jgi:hypothetical protein
MRKNLYDLGLTEDDFNFNFIEFTDQSYNEFIPTRTLVAEINGVVCKVRIHFNVELLQDIQAMTGIDGEKEIKKILKREAIDWYINNNQFIRKLKLQKIKDVQSG